LREYDAQVLTATPDSGDYFERVAKSSGDGRAAANWVMGDLAGYLKGQPVTESPVSAENLGELISLVASGEVSGKMAHELFAQMVEPGESARVMVDRQGLRQISDAGELGRLAGEVIAANPKQVEQYKSGKTAVLGFLVGQVMKASKGQANPAAVNELLREQLK
ncbi:MAG: Asp-tRNA(Asn)/Glu-tRNA(Gln) amidotransferase subunit GatB, partial [Bryobacteraceae bacterium]